MSERVQPLVSTLLDFRHDREVGFAPLSRALHGLSASQAAFRPNAHAHSIWELINHIAFWNEYVLRHLAAPSTSDGPVDNEQTFRAPPVSGQDAHWQAAVERTFSACQRLREAVFALDEAALQAPFDQEGTPLGVVLGDIAMHDAYHIGQIMYLRKLQESSL